MQWTENSCCTARLDSWIVVCHASSKREKCLRALLVTDLMHHYLLDSAFILETLFKFIIMNFNTCVQFVFSERCSIIVGPLCQWLGWLKMYDPLACSSMRTEEWNVILLRRILSVTSQCLLHYYNNSLVSKIESYHLFFGSFLK